MEPDPGFGRDSHQPPALTCGDANHTPARTREGGSAISDKTDKSDLLDQIKIDRSLAESSGGVSRSQVIVLMLCAAVLGGMATYFLIPATAVVVPGQVAKPAAGTLPKQASATKSEEAASNGVTSLRILNAAGYVTARRIATVSSEITGRIIEVNVEEGMVVQPGQILARLDNAVATVDLQLARSNVPALQARLEGIEANLAEARRVLAREQELLTRSLATEADVTRSETAVNALAADLRNARANMEVAHLQVKRRQELLDDHIVRAPFGGVITVKNAQTGEIVSPASAGGGFTRSGICTIVDMDSLEIEVDVNESFIKRVFPGQTVEAHLDAYPDWHIPASVIAIIPTADRAKATVRVRIRIEVKDTRILPDMGVKVAFLKNQ